MLLLAINTYKWIVANWRIVLAVSMLISSFWFGWCIKGRIDTAAQNAAIVAENMAKDKKELENNDKVKRIEQERNNLQVQYQEAVSKLSKARSTNRVYSDCLLPTDSLLAINQAVKSINAR